MIRGVNASRYQQNTRVDQKDVVSGGIRAGKASVILGDKRNGYLLINYVDRRIEINEGSANGGKTKVLIGFQKRT